MFDVISVGDSVIDTFIPLNDAEILKEGEERKLVLKFGSKIAVGPSVSMVAGNAANSAIGSARLKLKTAIYTHVGNKDDDKDDDRIKAKFKKEKVDLRYIAETDELPSNHNIVLNFQGERTILVYHQPWKYKLPELERTKWVYFTSLSETFVESNLVNELIGYLERTGAKLLYSPGTFQIKMGVKKNAKLLSLTELFIVNLEESKKILGIEEKEKSDAKMLLKKLSDLGPKLVVITDAENGSYGFDGENSYKLPVFPAKLIEMTGSGDAYATGVMAGLVYGKELPEAMRWGACNGAAVVEQVGSTAGLLTYTNMQEKLKLHTKIVAKKI